MTSPRLHPDTVYWLEDVAGVLQPEIAGDVEYRAQSRELCFYDTQRPHTFPAEYVGEAPDGALRFRREDGGEWRLRRLDCAAFDRVFRPWVHAPPPFASDEALQTFYRALIRSDP